MVDFSSGYFYPDQSVLVYFGVVEGSCVGVRVVYGDGFADVCAVELLGGEVHFLASRELMMW